MRRTLILVTILGALLLSLTGCVSYYRVTDPGTGKVYYTTDIEEVGAGAILFKDEVTMRKVTLQQSEIMEINSDQFEAAGKTREREE